MALRLLQKSEIAKAKAGDREREIQEGLKLAKKVDSLRELTADEETRFEKFRKETLSAIYAEIDGATSKRDERLGEVEDLEKRRKLALIPLEAEWKKVNGWSDSLHYLEDDLAHKETGLREREAEISLEETKIKNEKDRIEGLKERATENFLKSEEAKIESEEILNVSRQTLEVAEQEAETKREEATRKENDLALRELTIFETEKRQEVRHVEQDKRDRALNDKYQTLERTIKRLNG